MKNNKLITGIVLLAVLLGNRLQSQTQYTTVGVNTYTVPTCVYSLNVTCIGGGGAGYGKAGGGGGAGGVIATKLISVTPGQTYTLYVGKGGTGVSGGNGNSGENSTFGANLVVAQGGAGATSTTGAVATTTVSSVGDIISTGGAGGSQNTAGSSGTGFSATGGGGGGANGGTAGAGGAAVGSGGAGGAGGASGAAGAAGSIPGGGGGGAGGNFKGGDGGQGIVIVSEIQSTTSVNNATICPGQIATLNATLGDSYTWSTSETTSSINVSPATTTSYTVTGTGTCSGTAVSTVTVYKPVTVTSSTICTGYSTTLYASGPASYSWSTGATTSSITTPTLTAIGVTSYTVTGNNCGVLSTAYAYVVVRNCQIVTITSTGTWKVPSCVYSVDAEVWGGGGGAGGNSAVNGGTGGGGGGAYSMSTVTVTPGATLNVQVGAGGAAGSQSTGAGAAGGKGGDSWFINATTVMAKGGNGGQGGDAGAGGTGGAASAGYGTVRYSGGSGAQGQQVASDIGHHLAFGGGGGASAGSLGNGGNGGNATPVANGGGPGGISPAGGGGGNGGDGSGADLFGSGNAGAAPGGGAGGSADSSPGQVGGKGQIVLTFELSTPAVTATPSAEICPGTNATLTASGASSYTWTPTAGLSPTTGATVVATPTVTTTYTVMGTNPGCTVTATAKSVVTFTTCCVPATVSLTSAAGTNSQIVCVNAAITTITYTIGGGGLGATVNGLPTGITGTYSGGVFTMNGSLSALGTYNYTIVTSGGCAPVTTTGTIVVTSNAAIALTSAAGTNAQTLCVNTPLTKITYTISGGGTGATASGLPAGVSGSYNTGVYTISGTPTATGSFNYTVTTTGVCTQTNTVGTMTVNPYPVLTINNASICVGGVGTITAGGASSYSWSSSSATYTVSPANTLNDGPASTTTYSVTGTSLGCSSYTTAVINVQSSLSVGFTSTVICINNSTILTATGATSYTWTPGGATTSTLSVSPLTTSSYTVFGTMGTCSGTGTGTVTVKPDAAIALTSGGGTNTQTLCLTDVLTAITYTISGGGTGAIVSGLPSGVSGSYSAGIYTISGTPTVTGAFNYTVTTTGSCVQTNATGSIIIKPNAALGLSSTSGSDNQTVCVNTALSSITYTISGGATSATVTGLPAGITSSFSSNILTISGTPTAVSTQTVASTYTVTTAGTCTQTSVTGTITVTPKAFLGVVGASSQTLCINTPLTNITYTVSGGATGADVTGLPTGLTGTYSSGTLTISGTPTVVGTFGYTVNTTGGSCAQTSATGTIVGNPNTVVDLTSGASSNAQALCLTDVLTTITYSLSGGATSGAVTGLPAGVTGSYAANVVTISGTPTALGTFNYTLTTSGGCAPVHVFGSIVINSNAAIALTSLPATTSQTLCLTDALVPITYTVSGGGTSANVTGLPSGVTGGYSAGVVTISGTPTALGTYNYTVTTVGSCTQTSVTGVIIINPNAAIGLTSLPATTTQTLCLTDALVPITYTVTGGGTSANVTGLPTGVTGGYSAGVVTINGTPTALGTYNYTVTTIGSCTQTSVTGVIIINPNAAIALTSGPGSDVQMVCVNNAITTITYSISGGGTGAVLSGSLPSGVTGSYASGIFTISGTPTAVSSQTVVSSYTVATVGTCTQTALTGTITVYPDATIALTSGTTNQTVCINSAITTITYSISGGGTGATITGLPSGLSGSYSSPVYTISGSPSVKGTFNYTLTTNGGCVQKSMYGVIHIDTLPVAVSGGNTTICENASYTLVNGEASYANGSILWTENGSGTIIPGSETTLIPTYQAVAADAGKAITLTMTVTSTNSCFPKNAPATYTINVDPLPIANVGAQQPICENDSITISGATASYGTVSWIANGGGPLSYTTSLTPKYKAVSADQGKNILLTMTVTSTNSCATATATTATVVKVKPSLMATLTAQQSVCLNKPAPIIFIASQGTPNYSFKYIETVNGASTTKTVSTINGNDTAVIGAPTGTSGTVIYNLINVQDVNCSNSLTINTQTVTVNPLPTATINQDQDICRDSIAKNLVLKGSNGTSPYIFAFKRNNDTNPTLINGNDSALIKPETGKIGSVTYALVSVTDGNGCSQAQSGTATITVHENPHAIFTITPERTSILEPEITITDASIAATSWMWSFGDGKFSSAAGGSQTHTYADTGTYKIKLLLSNKGCKDSTSEIVRIYLPLTLYVPNTFTPNGDGFNDVFKAEADGFKKFEMFIFDRWGQLIFHSDDINKGWDGKANGGSDVAQIDTYVYVIVIKDLKKHDNTYRGTVNLIK